MADGIRNGGGIAEIEIAGVVQIEINDLVAQERLAAVDGAVGVVIGPDEAVDLSRVKS